VPGKEAKKRGRPGNEEKKDVKKADGASPAKRGRGRPKGSTKKKGKTATKVRLWHVLAVASRGIYQQILLCNNAEVGLSQLQVWSVSAAQTHMVLLFCIKRLYIGNDEENFFPFLLGAGR
jgi:hypothetical protein